MFTVLSPSSPKSKALVSPVTAGVESTSVLHSNYQLYKVVNLFLQEVVHHQEHLWFVDQIYQ